MVKKYINYTSRLFNYLEFEISLRQDYSVKSLLDSVNRIKYINTFI
jgi:hypothetical protein